MAQYKKVGWTGHINDNWLSFSKTGNQDLESNDGNDEKISELIEFKYDSNNPPSGRSTTVTFTQNRSNNRIIMSVKQKEGHVKIDSQTILEEP